MVSRVFKSMVSLMGMGISKLQIFYSIIRRIVIYMMNKFISFKKSSKRFFHNKTMFVNISLFVIWKRVTWKVNKNISKYSFNSSTFPYMGFFPSIMISNSSTFERTFCRTKQTTSRFFQFMGSKTKKFITDITNQHSSRSAIFTWKFFNNFSFHKMNYTRMMEVGQYA